MGDSPGDPNERAALDLVHADRNVRFWVGSGHCSLVGQRYALPVTIDKRILFETTKALWPATVNLSDPNATNDIYRKNESAFPQDDDWRQLALWSFHQALAAHEKRSLAKGLLLVDPHEVTFAEFDFWVRSNLNGDECWREERAEYARAD